MRPASLLTLAGVTITAAACGGHSASRSATAPAPAGFAAAPIDSSMMLSSPTGLQFRDLVVGHGAMVSAGNHVSVHYIGQLLNGQQFDANLPGSEPLVFQIGAHRVIPGWEEGVNGMRVGGRRQLIIPPALGYGSHGTGPIPPNATLVFTIEVLSAY